jgi:hypothetical protein
LEFYPPRAETASSNNNANVINTIDTAFAEHNRENNHQNKHENNHENNGQQQPLATTTTA